jgi:Stage II sporulation protein E (SpoIIE)
LHWREHDVERIESNGLLLGVMPEPEYPVWDIHIKPGDHFLLSTDGVIEAQNAHGDMFGDSKLEEVIRGNHSRLASEFLNQLLSEIGHWQTAAAQSNRTHSGTLGKKFGPETERYFLIAALLAARHDAEGQVIDSSLLIPPSCPRQS